MSKTLILLADNNKDFRQVWSEILSKHGYEILLASSQEEAHGALRSKLIDLAILDLRLKDDDDSNDISGLEIAMDEALRKTPKIILTGFPPSPENIRQAFDLRPDQLPPAASWINKDEAPDVLLNTINNILRTWPNLRLSTIKVSQQIKADHDMTRRQANYHYLAAAIVSIYGFSLIFLGIALAWRGNLSISLVGTASGMITEILVYLYFTRLDRANDRMDIYHRELLQTYWLEFLLATCEQLPAQKQVDTADHVIRQAADSWFTRPTKQADTSKLSKTQDK